MVPLQRKHLSEAALNTADLSLFQALETYDWAKAGILVLDTD